MIKAFKKIHRYIFKQTPENNQLFSLLKTYIFKFISDILNLKKPLACYNILKNYISTRKAKYFILYKKPINKLTFLYTLLKSVNCQTSRI